MFNLIGHENQFNNLIQGYKSGNLHSSIIIHGPKGIGKRVFLNKLIEEIFKNKFEEKNYKHHFNLFKNNTHPNIKILEKEIDKKSKKLKSNITIDQIRNLNDFIKSSPSIKDLNKIILIDSADDLNINSSNSLLKNLEEPNQNTYIFLISHQISSLPATIRSRCLKIKLNIHNFDYFKEIMINQIDKITDDEIQFFYDITYGSPGNAILLYEENILEIFNLTINCFYSNKISEEHINLANIIAKMENEKFKSYLSILKSILVILNKLKNNHIISNVYLSNQFNLLKQLSKNLTNENIIDRFEYLIKNESDLFTYNLDKKLFMLKFLTN